MNASQRSQRPASTEFAPFYATYVGKVADGDLLQLMAEQVAEVQRVFGDLSADEADQLHPPYTWSVRQVLGHLIDGERVFGYRAARFASGDTTELPSFDENEMVDGMDYQSVTASSLLEEWKHLRESNRLLFARLDDRRLMRSGVASGQNVTVRAIGWIIVGHVTHHTRIVAARLGRETIALDRP